MPKYSKQSQSKLDTCHEDIQRLFNEVIKDFDCTILEGYRDKERQNRLYDMGLSQIKFPNGKHNKKKSEAADVTPYPINWGDIKRMYYFAGYVKAKAESMKINIRWGGDWDNDTEVLDNYFNDLGHFELI